MQKKFKSLTDVKAEGFDCFLTAQSPMRTVVQSETSHTMHEVFDLYIQLICSWLNQSKRQYFQKL